MGSAREEVERNYSTRLIHMKQLACKREFIAKICHATEACDLQC